MPSVRWTPTALQDVQRLYRFLAARNPAAAQRAVAALRAGVQVLAEQPAIGRPVPDMDPAFREWLIPFGASGYVVLYHWDGAVAVILAARHHREAGYW
jgi:plasmid stabilization system protein ParE